MELRNLFKRKEKKEWVVIDENMAFKMGLISLVDTDGHPVDPRRVFNQRGMMNPGFVPYQWVPPVLIVYTPEKHPVVTGTVLWENGG